MEGGEGRACIAVAVAAAVGVGNHQAQPTNNKSCASTAVVTAVCTPMTAVFGEEPWDS